jgi:hypothetical protein
MRFFSSIVVCVSLLATTFAAGCAGDAAEDEVAEGELRQSANDPITLQNWESHSKLKENFDLKAEADVSFRERLWNIQTKENLCNGPGEESRTKMTDSRGKIRSMATRGGSDDHYSTLQVLYDATGKMRYVDSTLRSVNGTGEDHLVFFDKRGQVIWEVIREWRPAQDGLGTPGNWRTARPVTEDEFDAWTFDDHNFVDAPARVFDREPTCN